MEHNKNKNAETPLFLLSFTKSQRGKNIERTFFVSAGAQKGWEIAGSGNILQQYLSNPKNKFSVKCIFMLNIFVLLSTGKKARTISLKVFKIMAFKNWQQNLTTVTKGLKTPQQNKYSVKKKDIFVSPLCF